jgi:sec-independent protein translocase protein TatC
MATASSVMRIVDHLDELRRRMLWSLGVVAIATGASLALVFTFPVLQWLALPILAYLPSHKLAFTHPTDPFDVAMHTSIAFALVASLPMIIYQGWGFVRPAMSRDEGRVVGWAVGGSLVLFAAGVALAWGVVLPLAVQWLLGLQTEALTPIITAREYFAFAVDMALAFGLSFQLPVVIVALVWLDVIRADQLVARRRVALFASIVIGAFLTPGDLVWTTIALAVPLYALFELSIVAGRRVEHRRRLS